MGTCSYWKTFTSNEVFDKAYREAMAELGRRQLRIDQLEEQLAAERERLKYGIDMSGHGTLYGSESARDAAVRWYEELRTLRGVLANARIVQLEAENKEQALIIRQLTVQRDNARSELEGITGVEEGEEE
jgi:hypothetical protein